MVYFFAVGFTIRASNNTRINFPFKINRGYSNTRTLAAI